MLKTFIIIDLIFIFFFSNFYIENKKEFEQVQEIIKLANDNFENNPKIKELIKTISENNSINQEQVQEIIKLSSSDLGNTQNVEEIINQENIQEITNNDQYKQTLQELLRQINEASLSTHN